MTVSAPASLAALGFGIAAAHSGHWPMLLWFHLGEAAFAISFLLDVAVPLPLVRRARRGDIDPRRVARIILALAIAELTVLYLALADLVIKPSSGDAGTLSTGGASSASLPLVAAATALREALPATSFLPRSRPNVR